MKIKWKGWPGGPRVVRACMCVCPCLDAVVYPLGQDWPQISFVALGDKVGEMKSKSGSEEAVRMCFMRMCACVCQKERRGQRVSNPIQTAAVFLCSLHHTPDLIM